jgi:capsular exopolysaccharide synthesis family protein
MSDEQHLGGPNSESRPAPGPGRHAFDADTIAAPFPAEYEAAAPIGDGPDPLHFLGILHKWRWTAITVFLLIVAGTALYTFTTVSVYEAHVRVLVESDRLNIVKIEDIVAQDRSIETQIAVLQSRWLAKETMQAMHLLDGHASSARVAPSVDPKWKAALRGVRSKMMQSVGWLGPHAEAAPPGLGESSVESSRIDGFLAGLAVTATAKGVLDIGYRSSDRVLAAGIANGIARQYIEQNLEVHFAAVKEVNDWLAARVSEQRQKVDGSELALQRFREQNQIVVADGAENPIVAKLNELTAAATRTKAARLDKEASLNKMHLLRGDPDVLLRAPQMISDPIVQRLRLELDKLQHDRSQMAEKLQDAHPDMIKVRDAIQATQIKLQKEMDRVVESIREDVTATRSTENALTDTLERQKKEALALNRKGVDLGILEREAQSNRQIYDMLMQRARETSIAKEITPRQIRILDPAEVPRTPIYPRTRQNMLMAALTGLVMAVGLAFGLDQLDSRVKTPDEIKTRLGLPLLGFVPEVHQRNGSDDPPSMTNGAPSAFIEAIRRVRTNVLYSFVDESLKALVVTSASLSEGKTIVATNLAIAIAQTGQRVLLIDADMRRPTLHRMFNLKRDPGLSNLLVGTIKATEVVQGSGIPNLWVLPSGHRPPNPPELLGSQRFKSMLASFAGHFDWVLLDAPPIMPVTDACVLANKTTGVLFVVGAERVSRQVVRRSLEQLGNVEAHVLGGILTRVDIDRHRYYYSKYYHPRYGEYASLGSRDV